MILKDAFLADVEAATVQHEPLAELRVIADRFLAQGAARADLIDWCETARERFPAKEDAVLDLMDCLAGWCAPHARI